MNKGDRTLESLAREHFFQAEADDWLTVADGVAKWGVTDSAVRIVFCRMVEAGELVCVPNSKPTEFRRGKFAENPWGLSPRECEVAAALPVAPSTDKLAAALDLKKHTANDHLKSIFRKMGVRDKTAAAVVYDRWARGVTV